MKIGLLDVDSHNFPNLPLMKISAWYKSKNCSVENVEPLNNYDKVYVSKIFDFTEDYSFQIKSDEIIKGGTGYNINDNLLDEIEHIYPDYSLYNINDIVYGFLTRGCPRKCDFCIVSKKEGDKSVKVADLEEFYNGQKEIKLLDANILACKDREILLNKLLESKSYIDFTQGLDIRLLDDYCLNTISKMKIKMLHFA